jgi:hypothetical protein
MRLSVSRSITAVNTRDALQQNSEARANPGIAAGVFITGSLSEITLGPPVIG